MSTILCIEDNEDLLDTISEFVQDAGHTVLKALDGQSGFEMILQHKPDLVISNTSMRNKSGNQVLQEIRTKYDIFDHIPFIVFPSKSDKEEILQVLDAGADDYLTKPIDYKLLLRKVKARLRQGEIIKQKSNEAFLKLMSKTPNGNFMPFSDGQQEIEQTPQTSETEQAPDKIEEDGPERVFCSNVEIPNSQEIDEVLKDNGISVMGWLETSVSQFLGNVIPSNTSISKGRDGGLEISFSNINADEAETYLKQLLSGIRSKFHIEKIPEIIEKTNLTDEQLAQLDIISDGIYEQLNQKAESSSAAQQKLISEIVNVNDFIGFLENNNNGLQKLKLLDMKLQELPIKIYNFHEVDREIISSCFKKFKGDRLSSAEYELDMLFLRTLKEQSRLDKKTGALLVDAHYDTIRSVKFRGTYLPELRSLAKTSKDKVVLNVRRIPSNINVKSFKEQLKPISKDIKATTAQLAPNEYSNFIKTPLPVSGLICSYMSTQLDEFNNELLPKVKKSLPNSNIPMIVRGIPTEQEIDTLAELGFTGFGISGT